MTKKIRTVSAFLTLLLVPAVGGLVSAVSAVQADDDAGKDAPKKWLESLVEHRLRKDEDFKTSPFSPMAARVRLLVKAGQKGQKVFKVFFVRKNRDFSISRQEVPGSQFSLEDREDRWVWKKHAAAVTCIAGEKSIAPGSPLPQQCHFRVDGEDGYLVKVYNTTDGLVLLVFDPMRPEIRHFSHLYYFPPDPEYSVPATINKFPEITEVTMLTSQNLVKTFYRYALIRFKLDGKELQLTAFKFSLSGDEESNILFVPFADATSGKESYEVGRFLEIPEPKETNFILDFNYCYNPLCNYSPGYNCPIPPLENTLEVPIRAGEKTYPH
jgi:uncharacterized protein (DUF1684 family)